jgi:hypothetical protein
MESLIAGFIAAVVVGFISLAPKRTQFSNSQVDDAKKEIKRIFSVRS